MKKQQVSFENYNDTITQLNVKTLPDILQKGHQFFVEAQNFYDQESEIKETIDLYLEQLNEYLLLSQSQNSIRTSEVFIKEFLDMHNTVQTKKSLKGFIFRLQRALSNKQITKNDPLASHIEQLQYKLIKQYNDMLLQDKVKIVINRKWKLQLQRNIKETTNNNLSGIDCSIPKNSLLFTSFDQQPIKTSTTTFRLPAAMGKLLGDLEKFELAITIEGDQGGGKTRFTYQLANAFADTGNKVAIFTLEIGGKSDLVNRMREEYLSPQNRKHISRADRLPDSYNTIASAADTFDVIIIDSWNKTGLPSQDFDRLRKEHPNTIFIAIFQRTTQRTIRGGTAPLFDAGINIEVIKVDDTFQNNYAVTTKNRYGVTGVKYNIYKKEIIRDHNEMNEMETQQKMIV